MNINISNKNKRILLAEGFFAGRKIMSDIIKLLGYDFKSADNGYDVILLLKNEPFDLVLLDLELKQSDGFETIEHIRRNFDYPINTIPVIAMTNKDFSSDFNQTYKDEGFDGVIEKPFSLDDLDFIIKDVLRHAEKKKKNS